VIIMIIIMFTTSTFIYYKNLTYKFGIEQCGIDTGNATWHTV